MVRKAVRNKKECFHTEVELSLAGDVPAVLTEHL